MTRKLTLAEWAAQEFQTPPPQRTLRHWVTTGQIVPAPVKIGTKLYLLPGAKHVAEARGRLIDKLTRG